VNDRIYLGDDDHWYYRARGNTSVGPFEHRQQAEQTLAKQIRSWSGRAYPRTSWSGDAKAPRIFRRSATRQS